MTTLTHKFRSRKAAEQFVAEHGMTGATVTITKIATARYELVQTLEDPILDDIDLPKPVKAPKPTRVNRHWNDDGSLTIYIRGVKVRRFGGDENEDASEEELEDTEAFVERYLSKKFLKKNGGWIWGRTTQGHNWHTKRMKSLRAEIAEIQEAGGDASEKIAELTRLGGRL